MPINRKVVDFEIKFICI